MAVFPLHTCEVCKVFDATQIDAECCMNRVLNMMRIYLLLNHLIWFWSRGADSTTNMAYKL